MSSISPAIQPNFYQLKVFTENSALKIKHQEAAAKHNAALHEKTHPDSGYDLFVPNTMTVEGNSISQKINMEVKCSLLHHTYDTVQPNAFYLYPRSSTGSKTPLRLANSVGIIDSGYRGNIMAVFDNISSEPFTVEAESRLVQICVPTLSPMIVTIVDSIEELGLTERGSSGFGSTGK
jgi:dUTP pyrophosphatase